MTQCPGSHLKVLGVHREQRDLVKVFAEFSSGDTLDQVERCVCGIGSEGSGQLFSMK